MTRAANLKRRIATEIGTTSASGRSVATPAPEVLAELQHFAGLTDTKFKRLRGVAHAATNGGLDPDHLRTIDTSDALAELQTIDGIGPFSAELFLVRGAGAPDVFPENDKRVHALVQDLHDCAATSNESRRDLRAMVAVPILDRVPAPLPRSFVRCDQTPTR